MKLLTGGPSLDTTLATLADKYDHITFAVAWASAGTLAYKALLRHRSKIQQAVIGTHFYQTHPNVLDDFIGSKHVRFVMQPKGVFHPKAYLFWDADSWELLLGSANLTGGGMGDNEELMLHLTSQSAPLTVRNEVQEKIQHYWEHAEGMTRAKADEYRAQWHPKREYLRNLTSRPAKGKRPKADVDIEIIQKPWKRFVKEVKADKHGYFQDRCALLRAVGRAFKKHESFATMDIEVRKMVAGLDSTHSRHWGYFGSMMGAGYFKHVVLKDVDGLSRGLDAIPLEGPVYESMFQAYIAAFQEAMPDVKDGIGTATRLLAMKRPDFFVGLDEANKRELCKAFGIVASRMDYQRYWDEILVRIHDSVWWNAPKPGNATERLIWNARAAMLDALYYDPKQKT